MIILAAFATLLSAQTYVFVSDMFTLADSCGCDSCCISCLCDTPTVRDAVVYTRSHAWCRDGVFDRWGAQYIWWDNATYSTNACSTRHTMFHFVDTFYVDTTEIDEDDCCSAVLFICADDFTQKVYINGNCIRDTILTAACATDIILGGTRGLPIDLYVEPGINVLEICAFSAFPEYYNLRYALRIHCNDSTQPAIVPVQDDTAECPVWYCIDDSGCTDLSLHVVCDSFFLDTNSIYIRYIWT